MFSIIKDCFNNLDYPSKKVSDKLVPHTKNCTQRLSVSISLTNFNSCSVVLVCLSTIPKQSDQMHFFLNLFRNR